MDIQFTDSFGKSLKRLRWHQSPLYRSYELFRYKIPHFISNVWRFRHELWSHHWWDYRFTLDVLSRSLTIQEKGLSERGHEINETRNPKVKSIRRVLELLHNNKMDNYIERAEAEIGQLIIHDWEWEETGETSDNPMGEKNEKLYALVDKDTPEEKEHNRKVFERAKEIEEAEWKELWEIFKGTENSKMYGEKYDGTDMRAWWD